MGSRRHTATEIAKLIAVRVEQHTLPRQFLYGATTDNADNVVRAAKLLVQQYDLLLEVAHSEAKS